MTTPPGLRALLCHPATPSRAIHAVSADCRSTPQATLQFRYEIAGDLARVRLPVDASRERRDRLWEHTCCEAFIATGPAVYLEFNFAPAGHWAAYRFKAYRDAERPDPEIAAPRVDVGRTDALFTLAAEVAIPGLPGITAGATLKIALAAVIEECDGVRSYWALHHPRARPDFHDRRAFVMAITQHGGPEPQRRELAR